MRAIRCFTIRATLPEPLAGLRDLMLNLRWSWHADTRELFAAIDPAGRPEAGRDPTALLGEVPPEHLARLAADPGYLARLGEMAADLTLHAALLERFGDILSRGLNDRLADAVARGEVRSDVTAAEVVEVVAGSASWPVTISRRRATSACR